MWCLIPTSCLVNTTKKESIRWNHTSLTHFQKKLLTLIKVKYGCDLVLLQFTVSQSSGGTNSFKSWNMNVFTHLPSIDGTSALSQNLSQISAVEQNGFKPVRASCSLCFYRWWTHTLTNKSLLSSGGRFTLLRAPAWRTWAPLFPHEESTSCSVWLFCCDADWESLPRSGANPTSSCSDDTRVTGAGLMCRAAGCTCAPAPLQPR